MSKMIGIQHIDVMEQSTEQSLPLYVFICGGIASGKNHVVQKYVREIPIMDVDAIMERNGWTDYTGEHFDQAMAEIGDIINRKMYHDESLVAMGSGSNIVNAVNRLHNAKMEGYTTVLVHIDVSVEQAYKQNGERRDNGKRYVPDGVQHKIMRTVTGAAQVAATLRDTDLVDHFCYYQNIRTDL